MKRKISLLCSLTVLFVLSGIGAYAQSETDFGIWNSIQVTKNWAKPYAFLRAEHRSCQNSTASEAWFISMGGGYKFTPWIKADLSYERWAFPVSGNSITRKGILVVTGTLKRDNLAFVLREKCELAHSSSTNTFDGNFRTRIRGQYRFETVPLTPYFMYEFFTGVNRGWYKSLHYAGTEISLSQHHKIDVFYVYNLYPTATSTNSRHLLGLGYYFNF